MPGIVLSIVAALVDLACATLGYDDFRVVTKPLVALILAATAWRGGARYLAAGLLFAAAGDELLLRDDPTRFMAGMGAFLVMQICFILALQKAVERVNRFNPVTLLYVAATVLTLYMLSPYTGTMFIPLAIYALALMFMARTALDAGWITAIGGLIFMASDTTLAFGKYYPDFPLPPHLTGVLVDGSYFIAIILIVAGLLNRKGAGDVLRSAV